MANYFLWGGLTLIVAVPLILGGGLPLALVGAILMIIGIILLILGK